MTRALAAALIPIALGACAGTRTIENTSIADTEENREIYDIVESYRHAVERRDVGKLLSMADKDRYFEDGGTAKGDDDYGYEGLKEVLRKRFAQVKTVRYGLLYRGIDRYRNRADVRVFIDASFQIETADGKTVWQRMTDDNKLELINDGKGWRFIAGM